MCAFSFFPLSRDGGHSDTTRNCCDVICGKCTGEHWGGGGGGDCQDAFKRPWVVSAIRPVKNDDSDAVMALKKILDGPFFFFSTVNKTDASDKPAQATSVEGGCGFSVQTGSHFEVAQAKGTDAQLIDLHCQSRGFSTSQFQ